jgi:hypothetical protein
VRTLTKIVAVLAAACYIGQGIWAFVAPESFAENIANYPPYSEHLVRDGGAFAIGLGVAALAGLLLTDALAAVLAGVAAASLLHGVSHIMDQELGGRPSDPWTVSAIGLAILCGFMIAVRSTRTRQLEPAGHRELETKDAQPMAGRGSSPTVLSRSAPPPPAGRG